MRVKNSLAEQVEQAASRPPEESVALDGLFSFGSTLTNLACSDRADGSFAPGEMVNIIGDSNSGKTLAAFTIFAETARDRRWDGHAFVYDDVEAANRFNVPKLFGKSVSDRLQYLSSGTIEEFQTTILKLTQRGKPFVYVLDSLDALTSDEEVERGKQLVDGKEPKGTMGATKAKALKQILRMVVRELRKTESLLVIISQTIDNIGGGPWSPKRTRAGGNALRFFASHELWLTLGEKIKIKEREIGVQTKLRVARSKLTGKTRTVSFEIYYDYGIDDIGSCVDFMVGEGYWTKRGDTVKATDLGLEFPRKRLIQQIEDRGLEQKLRQAVGAAWHDIEESLRLKRKAKYE